MPSDRPAPPEAEPTGADRAYARFLIRANKSEDDRINAIAHALAVHRASAVAEIERRKDGAYEERNRVVAALARAVIASGWRAGIARTAIEGWSDDWHGCVYIETPEGQLSWHYHDSHAHLFADLPAYEGAWDGHTTPEKYERVARLSPEVWSAQRASVSAEHEKREREARRLLDSVAHNEPLYTDYEGDVRCAWCERCINTYGVGDRLEQHGADCLWREIATKGADNADGN